MKWAARFATVVVLLAASGGVVFVAPAYAGTVASGPVNTIWPFAVAANGAKPGTLCTFTSASSDPITGPDTPWSFTWNNTVDGEIGYACEAVSDPATHVTAPGTSGSTSDGVIDWKVSLGSTFVDVVSPLQRNGTWKFPCTSSTGFAACAAESAATSFQVVQQSFQNTTSSWYRFSGLLVLHHGCQPSGSALGTSACGGSSPWSTSTQFGANPSTTDICPGATGFTTNVETPSGKTVQSNGLQCNVVVGGGVPASAPIGPDNQVPPQGGGSCRVSSVLVSGDAHTGGFGTPIVTTHGQFTTPEAATETLRYATVVTWSGGPIGITAVLWQFPHTNVPTTITKTYAMPATTSGATVQLDIKPTWPVGSVTAAVRCSIANKDRDQFNYASAGDSGSDGNGQAAGYHGAAAYGPVSVGAAGNTSATGCFDGLFFDVDFYGLATFPWMHITNLPGDVLCFIEALVLPQETFTAIFSSTVVAVQSSVLGSAGSTVADVSGSVVDFATTAASGATDCAGPGAPVDVWTFHPFDMCSGNASTLAIWVYDVLAIAIGITGGFWALSILRRILGGAS